MISLLAQNSFKTDVFKFQVKIFPICCIQTTEFSLSVFTVDYMANRLPVDEYKTGKHIKIFQK